MAYDLWHRCLIPQSFARGDGSSVLDTKALVMAGAVIALPYVARFIDIRSHRHRLRDRLTRTTLELPAMPMSEMVYGEEEKT
jgi:hypothetical protein